MEGRKLLQYIIDTSDVVLAKKQEATEYLAKLEEAAKQGLRPTKGIRPAKKALSKPRHFELGYPRSVETAQQSVQWTLRLWAWLKNLIGLGLRR